MDKKKFSAFSSPDFKNTAQKNKKITAGYKKNAS